VNAKVSLLGDFQETRVIVKNCTVKFFKDRAGFVVIWLGFSSKYFLCIVFWSMFGILMCQFSSKQGDMYWNEENRKD